MWAPLDVLLFEALGTSPVEDRSQPPDFGTANSRSVVYHQARDRLCGALAEDSCLALVDREAFIPGDVSNPCHQVTHSPFEAVSPGEREVVGIAGIREFQLRC